MIRATFTRRPLFLGGLCALLGVLAAQYSFLLSLFLALLILGLFLLFQYPSLTAAALILLMLFFTAYTRVYETHALNESKPFIGDDITLKGRIVSLPKPKNYGQSFILQCENTRIFVIAYQKGASFGDLVTLKADCKRPQGARREGEFDFSNYLKSQNIYLCAYADRMTVTDRIVYPTDAITILRAKLLSRADTLWSGEPLMFIRPLLLGNSDLSSNDFRDKLSRAGLSHIIAVSGLHVSFIIGMAATLFRRSFIRRRLSVVCLFLLVFYVLLTGASPSTVRAGVMLSLAFLATVVSSPYDSLSALAFAALCLLATNPFIIYSLSFLLSFAAVLGIFLFYRPLESYLRRLPFFYATKVVGLTFCAQVFTFPILVFSFGRVACLSLLANMAVVPLIPVIMLCGYAALALSALSFLSLPIARICEVLIRFILWVAHYADTLPLAGMDIIPSSVPLFLLSYGAAVLFLITLLIIKKRLFILLSCALAFCLFLANVAAPFVLPRQCLCFLDAGNGDAAVAVYGKNAIMIECQSRDDTFAKTVVIPFLKRHGVTSLDVLAITEYNSYDPNVIYLLDHFPVVQIMLPNGQGDEALFHTLQNAGTRVISIDTPCKFGALSLSSYTAGDHVGFCLLHPYASVFFSGTLKEGDAVPHDTYDLLKIGLGGRGISLDPALLSAISPKEIIISSRYRPSNKLLKSMEHYSYHSTSQGGNLYVKDTPNGVSVIPYLKQEADA